ncbi:MAG: alpha/beta fold hydrolase [Phenylobacterium sp.]|nr:alpha/beta hydrolase [Phenylobacterium sp.]
MSDTDITYDQEEEEETGMRPVNIRRIGAGVLALAGATALSLVLMNSREAHGQTEAQTGAEIRQAASTMAADRPTAAQWKAMGKQFSFQDQSVFYIDLGAGSATLAIHGYPTSSWDFRLIAEKLGQRSRFVALDLPGFGYSGKSDQASYTIVRQADAVSALAAHLGVNRVRLIGSDIGVAVVQELMSRERAQALPYEIESVVLINGSLFADQFKPSASQTALLSPLGGLVNRRASEEAVMSGLIQITGPERRIPESEFLEVWKLLNHPGESRLLHKTLPTVAERKESEPRWTEALCESTMPLMLVVGLSDPTAGKDMVTATEARCKGSRRFQSLQLDRAGHFPHLEYAEETAQGILAWSEGGY